MENMRFKVGDRIRIKSLDWYNENKSKSHRTVACGDKYFEYDMKEWCGKTMTIIAAYKTYYIMKEDGRRYMWTDEMIEGLVEEETYEFLKTDKPNLPSLNDFMDMLNNEISLPEGYQFKDENGNVINATKIVLEKKKKEYPKTYKECCEVLDIDAYDLVLSIDYRSNKMKHNDWKRLEKLNTLNQILICRDAYLKLYSEENGLEKPWEPDWTNEHQVKYTIYTMGNDVIRHVGNYIHAILAFSTAEMRDAFYENFKELIETVKELL